MVKIYEDLEIIELGTLLPFTLQVIVKVHLIDFIYDYSTKLVFTFILFSEFLFRLIHIFTFFAVNSLFHLPSSF